ncbi:uncharacterized protein BO88DRAFT_88474 [Aspergillus vadensis CBS 113365]|uniref:Uncharacterized protein n=1 Tax=Aspergillus vadensis (strain CBS 113365 / IMI 142717 / IBT 24658) TaxID=1448311 RepID=A0A319B2W1_ASPVC|nr:hypothetical protein BO88DRAFT_88474 [Aspergillus vadensis CBS 113365]PYH66829.1 hypothetical protein BO88DRAFT_88474 [Aspergillus vadensis CBS 113365]
MVIVFCTVFRLSIISIVYLSASLTYHRHHVPGQWRPSSTAYLPLFLAASNRRTT